MNKIEMFTLIEITTTMRIAKIDTFMMMMIHNMIMNPKEIDLLEEREE